MVPLSLQIDQLQGEMLAVQEAADAREAELAQARQQVEQLHSQLQQMQVEWGRREWHRRYQARGMGALGKRGGGRQARRQVHPQLQVRRRREERGER